jgi:Tol biopolymer transport system component
MKKVVYYSKVGNNTQLFTINVNGTENKQLTDFSNPALNGATSGDPCWSPDSKVISFSSNKDKSSIQDGDDIYTINADGTNLTRLTNSNTTKWFTDWQ